MISAKRGNKPKVVQRILALYEFHNCIFKTFQKKWAYAFFEPIYFITAIFGPKIAQKCISKIAISAIFVTIYLTNTVA